MPARATEPDPLHATEHWFVKHGLPYFVPHEREAARRALHPRRTVPLGVVVVLTAVALAASLAWLSEDLTFAPATLTLIGVVAAAVYAVTELRAMPILGWAVTRTVGDLRQLLPTLTRALPLLLVFMTFLFINAEVWHVSSQLDGGLLWLTVLLFTLMGLAFFLVRLPEEIDRADAELDDERIVAVCATTPMAEDAARLAQESPGALSAEAEVTRFERGNLTLALLVVQSSQVFLVALSLLAFFLVFGTVAMDRDVVEAWIGERTHHLPGLVNVSVELLQVSVFLAAFSALYFTVYAVTDETFRDQFFTGVMREMERAVALRAVYQAVRHERGEAVEEGAPVGPAPTVPLEPLDPGRAPEV